MSLFTKKKQTRERICGCQGNRRVGEFETDRHTLLCLKWITNKALLYRMEALLSATRQVGGSRVWERMCTCTCIAESLCRLSEILRTLLIGYTPI